MVLIIHCSPDLTRVKIMSTDAEKETFKSKKYRIRSKSVKKGRSLRNFVVAKLSCNKNNIALPEDEWFLSLVRK